MPLESKPICYSLAEQVELQPLDSSAPDSRYLVRTQGGQQFDVTQGVASIIELLRGGQRTAEELARELRGSRFTHASHERISQLLERVLIPKGIVRGAEEAHPAEVTAGEPRSPEAPYLWLKVPLVRAEALRPLTGPLAILFKPALLVAALGAGVAAHVYFYTRVLPSFEWSLSTLPLSNYALLLVMMTFTSLCHELGHATACRYYDCPHGRIGLGAYLYMLVFYTDVSAVWRLKRTQRAVVDSGGMYFELLMAVVLLGLWLWLQAPLLIYAFVLLDVSILGSLNPILRRDGYWLLADLSGHSHLRRANMEVLRHWLRRLLRRPVGAGPLGSLKPWVRVAILAYSAASVLFTLVLVYFIWSRLIAEFIPRLPGLMAELASGLRAPERDYLGLLDTAARLLFCATTLFLVGVSAFRFFTFLFGWLRRSLGTLGKPATEQGDLP